MHLFSLGFENVGTTPCSLGGYPQFTVLDPAGAAIPVPIHYVSQLQRVFGPESTASVTLQPGGVGGFYAIYIHNPANECDRAPTTLEAAPPGSTQSLLFTSSSFEVCSDDLVYVSPVHLGDAYPPPSPAS